MATQQRYWRVYALDHEPLSEAFDTVEQADEFASDSVIPCYVHEEPIHRPEPDE